MNADLRRGLLGVALLTLATAAIAGFEATRFEAREVAWTFATLEAGRAEGALGQGDSTDVDIDVTNVANVRSVTAILSWTDEIGDADAFELRVAGPQGQNATSEPDASGEIRLVVPVAEPPAQLVAPNAVSAQHLAALMVDPERGVGTWTITIGLPTAPGAPAPVGPVEMQADGENAYELRLVVETYAAS